MKKILSGVNIIIGLLFATPVFANTSVDTSYSPKTQARIRIYGQNQFPTILEFEQDGKKHKINHGGSLGGAFKSLVGSAKNISIGMPTTTYSQNIQQQNGILSKMTYQEIVIPTDKPIKLRTAFIGLTNVSGTNTDTQTIHYQGSCQGEKITFTPKAGVDYEVIPNQDKNCLANVVEIHADGSMSAVVF